jgi:hypothetical protein
MMTATHRRCDKGQPEARQRAEELVHQARTQACRWSAYMPEYALIRILNYGQDSLSSA